jgi:hypothetical protein
MSHHMMITQRVTISPPGYAHPEAECGRARREVLWLNRQAQHAQ